MIFRNAKLLQTQVKSMYYLYFKQSVKNFMLHAKVTGDI